MVELVISAIRQSRLQYLKRPKAQNITLVTVAPY